MKKLELNIFTCFHQRAELSAMWLANMEGLAKYFDKSCTMRIFVAVTKDDAPSIALCQAKRKGLTLHHEEVPNDPVGAKWNYALARASQLGSWDYLVKADDDGLVTRSGFSMMLSEMHRGRPYIGFRGEAFVDADQRKASYFQYPQEGKCMGTFKAWNQEALEAAMLQMHCEHIQKLSLDHVIREQGDRVWYPAKLAGWLVKEGIVQPVKRTDAEGAAESLSMRINLWERWNRNLDWCSDARLALNGIQCTAIESAAPLLCNVKLPGKNIWPFEFRGPEGQPYPWDKLKDLLTFADFENLKALAHQAQDNHMAVVE